MKIKRPFWIVLGAVVLLLSIFATYLITSFIDNKKYETQVQSNNAEIMTLNSEIDQYIEQVVAFAETQQTIRSYVNELVELLYARESYLGVGGLGNDLLVNEQTPLFQLKSVINNLNDDQEAMKMVKDYLKARRQFAESFPFTWPIPGGVPRISSGYGVRANEEVGSILGDRNADGIHFHAGIDIPGDKGDPISATADGRVIYIQKQNPTYGKVVVIQHDYGFQTLYGHMMELNVRYGQYVKRWDIIGYMGNTIGDDVDGNKDMGVHLHYEIKKDGYHIDPMSLLGLNY